MAVVLEKPLMTTADLLAMPPNGKERWLIASQHREKFIAESWRICLSFWNPGGERNPNRPAWFFAGNC